MDCRVLLLLPTKVVTRSGTLSVPDPIYCVWCVVAERVGERRERGRKKNDGFLFSPFVCLFVCLYAFCNVFFPLFVSRAHFFEIESSGQSHGKNEVSGY